MKLNKNVEDAAKRNKTLKRIASLAKRYSVVRVENGIGYDGEGNEVLRELTKEQEKYVDKEMRGWDSDINRNANGGRTKDQAQGQRQAGLKKLPINKYSANGRFPLHESIIIGQVPKFVCLDTETKKPIFKDLVDEVFVPGCNINTQNPLPMIFDSEKQFSEYLKLADSETLDSLFEQVELEYRKYVNVEEHYYPLLVGDTIWTWFQDRFGYTHYIIIVGDNGSGKNSALLLFKYLGYRVFYVVSASAANYYTKMGNIEEGQITIAEDEAEDIAEDREKRNVYKTGYCSGASIPKVELDGGRSSEDWLTYCQKWAAMEELPEDRNMKGILDRSLVLKFVVGNVPYNIKDVIRSAGEPKFKPLYEQLIHLRKLLFCYRLLHHNDIISDVDLNVKNRTQELTKSLIRLFQNSPIALERILDSLSRLMLERNEVKKNSFESKLHQVITELVEERRADIATLPSNQEEENKIAQLKKLGELTFTNQSIKEKCKTTMEAQEMPEKIGVFYSPEVGTFSQSKITRILKSKFKADPRPVSIDGKTFRCMKFKPEYLDRIRTYYEMPKKIEISRPKQVTKNYGITQITETNRVSNENYADFERANERENAEKMDRGSPDFRNFRNSVPADKVEKVKCPECDYWDWPFYLKVHLKNQHGIFKDLSMR